MNWRAIFWWLGFSVAWTLTLFAFFDLFILCAFLGALLGFLTLCGTDIWMAWRHRRALRDEFQRKRWERRQS